MDQRDLEEVVDKRDEKRKLQNPGIHSEMHCPLVLGGRVPRGFEGRPFEFGMFFYRLVYGVALRAVSTFRTINETQRLVYLYEEQIIQKDIFYVSDAADAQDTILD